MLPNGLTVCTAKTQARVLSVSFTVDVGSMHDGEDPGIAHLLEHLVFEGASRNQTHPEYLKILLCGADCSAQTSFSGTSFSSECLAEHLPMVVASLLQMIIYPTIATEGVDQERKVILNERLDGYHSDLFFYKQLRDQYPDQKWLNIDFPILGDPDSLARIDANRLKDFHQQWYGSQNLFMVVVGNYEHEAVVELAQSFDLPYGGAKSGRIPSIKPKIQEFDYEELEVNDHLIMYFPEIPETNYLIAPVNLLQMLLNAPRLGFLWNKIRTNNLNIYSFGANKFEPAHFMRQNRVRISTSRENFAWAVQCIREILRDVIEQRYPDGLWQAVRSSFTMKDYHALDSQESGLAKSVLASWAFLGETPFDMRQRYDSITKDDVSAAVQEYMNPDHHGIIRIKEKK